MGALCTPRAPPTDICSRSPLPGPLRARRARTPPSASLTPPTCSRSVAPSPLPALRASRTPACRLSPLSRLSRPAARPAPCALLATLGSTRTPSTSPWAGTHPASRTCMPCFTCAAPHARWPPNLHSRARSPARRFHRDRAPYTRGVGSRVPLIPRMCPPCDSAGRKLPVHRQQAEHPLRVGGHPGLRLRWLWPRRLLRMALGSLRLKPSPRCACGRGRVYGGCLYHSPQLVRGGHTYTDVRAGRRKQTSSGCGCLTSARECRSSMCVLCG